MHKLRLAALAVSILGIVAIFLPWVNQLSILPDDFISNGLNISVTKFYGLAALLLFLLSGLLSFKGNRREAPSGMTSFFNILIGVAVVADVVIFISRFNLNIKLERLEIGEALKAADFDYSFGYGLYLTLVAGMLLVLVPAGLRYLKKEPTAETNEDSPQE